MTKRQKLDIAVKTLTGIAERRFIAYRQDADILREELNEIITEAVSALAWIAGLCDVVLPEFRECECVGEDDDDDEI